jgi:hypothetical protein
MGGSGRPGQTTGGGYCTVWFLCIALMPLALLLSACAMFGQTPVYGEIPECELLIPPSLKAAVPGVAIPNSEEAQPWQEAFIGQTGQLEKANERGPAIDYIYKNCLELHRRALKRSQRGFFGRIFG